MLTRISNKKIVYIFDYAITRKKSTLEIYVEVAQAQLEADQEKVQEIFKEIEKELPTSHYENAAFEHIPEECKLCWWQAFKERWLE